MSCASQILHLSSFRLGASFLPPAASNLLWPLVFAARAIGKWSESTAPTERKELSCGRERALVLWENSSCCAPDLWGLP